MKMPEALNTILIAITVCAVAAACVSCTTGHPRPSHEIYEARAPHTDRPVVRIQNTRWPGEHKGVWPVIIKFRQADGAVVSMELLIQNDPNDWTVWYCRPDKKIQEIGINRVYGPSVYPLNFSHKCWVEEGESFY